MISKRFLVGMTSTIHADWWDANETVTIKKLTWLDVQEIFGAAATVDSGEGNKTKMSFKIDAYQAEILKRGIASWTFLGADGNPTPATLEFIALLSPEDGNFILNEINKFNPEMNKTAEDAGFHPEQAQGSNQK